MLFLPMIGAGQSAGKTRREGLGAVEQLFFFIAIAQCKQPFITHRPCEECIDFGFIALFHKFHD